MGGPVTPPLEHHLFWWSWDKGWVFVVILVFFISGGVNPGGYKLGVVVRKVKKKTPNLHRCPSRQHQKKINKMGAGHHKQFKNLAPNLSNKLNQLK